MISRLIIFIAILGICIALDISSLEPGSLTKTWVPITTNALSLPVSVPVMILKAKEPGPTVLVTSTIHGNEVCGIGVIHKLFSKLSTENFLKGTLIAVVVVNVEGFQRMTREYIDMKDLNRLAPGDPNGNMGKQYMYHFFKFIVDVGKVDYVFDLHTTQDGINVWHVRVDKECEKCWQMAKVQNPIVILNDSGKPGLLRTELQKRNIPTITIELGAPSVFNNAYIDGCTNGILSFLKENLNMVAENFDIEESKHRSIYCTNLERISAPQGGLLRVIPKEGQVLKKGDLLATLHNVFGDLVEKILAPRDGVIITRATNPTCPAGCRIVHFADILSNDKVD